MIVRCDMKVSEGMVLCLKRNRLTAARLGYYIPYHHEGDDLADKIAHISEEFTYKVPFLGSPEDGEWALLSKYEDRPPPPDHIDEDGYVIHPCPPYRPYGSCLYDGTFDWGIFSTREDVAAEWERFLAKKECIKCDRTWETVLLKPYCDWCFERVKEVIEEEKDPYHRNNERGVKDANERQSKAALAIYVNLKEKLGDETFCGCGCEGPFKCEMCGEEDEYGEMEFVRMRERAYSCCKKCFIEKFVKDDVKLFV